MRPSLALGIAAVDLRRRLRNRSLLATGIAGPMLLAAIISFAFGSGSLELRVGVQDLDRSAASRALVTGFVEGVEGSGGEDQRSLVVEVIDPSRPAEKVVTSDDGPAAVIVVPAGFADSLTQQRPRPLEVVAEDGEVFTAEIAQAIAEGLAAEIDRTRLVAAAAARVTGGVPDPSLLQAGAAVPPIVATRAATGEQFGAASYFAPAMTMFFLFLTLGTGASGLIADRRNGVLARMRATPVGDTTILLGRTAAVVGLGLLSAVTMWAISGPLLGADWGPPLPALVVIVCVVLAISGLSMLVMAFARTEAQVSGATSILGFGMALLGGTFVAVSNLPPLLASVSLFTPNGLAQRGFTELSLGTADLADIWWVPAGLLAMAAVSGGVAVVVIRRRVLA